MIIIALADLNDLDRIIASRADGVIVGLEGLAARSFADVSVEKLKKLTDQFHARNKKVFVNALGMVEQKNTTKMHALYEQVQSCGVDGLYVADEAYLDWARQWEEKSGQPASGQLIYQPETLICSGEDARFYIDCGMQAASLSHELSVSEMEDCAAVCEDLEMLIAGRYSWMETRRPVVENYLRMIDRMDRFEAGKVYDLRELQRPGRMKIWQDQWGSHILSAEVLQAGSDIVRLEKAGIHRFRIDGMGLGNCWAAEMADLYATALDQPASSLDLPVSTLRQEQSLIRKEKGHGH